MTKNKFYKKKDKDSHLAVIGAGISGLTIAMHLSKKHKVTIYEANNYLGGHALTLNEKVLVNNKLTGLNFDVGFLVYNNNSQSNSGRKIMAKKNGKNGKVNYDAALNYPLFEAIFNRRSRRFGAGMELPSDSSLGHKSGIPPIPLTEFQEAMLVWAGTGLTGLCLADLPPENGIDLLCQWTGRTWPSACNNHGTELFFTNDSGLYWVDVKNMLPKDKELDMFFKLDRDDKIERLLELNRDGT